MYPVRWPPSWRLDRTGFPRTNGAVDQLAVKPLGAPSVIRTTTLARVGVATPQNVLMAL